MVLPPINLNLDAKTVGILCAVILVSGSLLSIGYQLGNKDPQVICKSYIKELAVATSQINSQELKTAKKVETAALECVSREKESCTKLVNDTVNNLKRLRCKICDAENAASSAKRRRRARSITGGR